MPSQSPPSFSGPQAVRARWVFPVHRPPIQNGIVTFQNRQVLAVNTTTDVSPVVDLGNVALLPGLVNCHTHLEFSELAAPLGRPGMPFPDWIREVIAHRRSTSTNSASAIALGLNECHRTGTVLLGEISTTSAAAYRGTPQPALVRFQELLGLAPERVDQLCVAARQHLETLSISPIGLSPHAPYTVHPDVLKCAVSISQAAHIPLAMHLAESREELELLRTHCGQLLALLSELNAWHPQSQPFRRPLQYLHALAQAWRTLVIHGNYLDDEEIQFLAAARANMSVIFCPRTHAFFQHDRYPLAQMLQRGVRVALGTDSRASNPNLSLFQELKFLAAHYSEIEPEELVRMATLAGAEALGMDDKFGALRAGRVASFAVASLAADGPDPYDALWNAGDLTVLEIS